MKNKWFSFALIFELLAVCSVSWGQTVITHDDGIGGDPAADARTDGSDILDRLRPDGSTNHLFENIWYSRLSFDNQRNVLDASSTVASLGNVITQTGSASFFTWQLVTTLLDGPTANSATVKMKLSVTNTSEIALSLAIFNYNDFELNGTILGDSELLGGLMQVRSQEGSIFGDAFAVGATAWEAGDRDSVRAKFINATVDNLSNAGPTFGPGDVASAFQWTASIPVGGQQSFSASLVISAVPEPNSIALMITGASVLLKMRRRFRRT